MTLIDLLTQRYEYDEGENGARTVRRKTQATLAIFGKGKTQVEPFRPVSEALRDVLGHCRAECGPCTRLQVLEALHKAAELQEVAEVRARKGSR